MSNFEFSRQFMKVNVPKRSGFDKSFKNLLTTKVGTITPILCDELIPGSRVNLKTAINACLPPLASETFMNTNLKVEAFFVPMRQLYAGFESWLTGEKSKYAPSAQYTEVSIPRLVITTSDTAFLSAGSLADYLGYRFLSSDLAQIGQNSYWNVFPFLAYHWVYDNWYRNSLIQSPIFCRPSSGQTISVATYPSTLPYARIPGTSPTNIGISALLSDGVSLGTLRQRNFDLDYFTTAYTSAQNGAPQSVTMSFQETGTAGNTITTGYTIASLRAANSLQQFAERQQYGFRLVDYVKANYGATLSDGLAQRPLLLGKQTITVYTKGVTQTALFGGASNNPFNAPGNTFGKAVCVGSGQLIEDFVANEPGYLMVMATLVPKVNYATGVLRQNFHYTAHSSVVDMANPLLQNTGNQPILQGELAGSQAIANPDAVFGYTDKYAEFMTREDEVHGLVRDEESLESYALQRSFATGVQINDAFLKIPTNFMDQVTNTNADISQYGTWIDAFFSYKVSMPLAQYSIPSLQDPAYEHGKEVKVKKGGKSVY